MEKKREKISRQFIARDTSIEKLVLDTSTLIDYVHGYASWLNALVAFKQDSVQLVLPTIVIAEYFTSTALEDEHKVAVANRTFSLFYKQDLTEEIAKVLGTILRRQTHPSGASLADLIVAATAISLEAFLATGNKTHFASIPDLRLFDPKKYLLLD